MTVRRLRNGGARIARARRQPSLAARPRAPSRSSAAPSPRASQGGPVTRPPVQRSREVARTEFEVPACRTLARGTPVPSRAWALGRGVLESVCAGGVARDLLPSLLLRSS